MTIREALRNSFPFAVANATIEVIAVSRVIDVDGLFEPVIAASKEFQLAKADIIKSAVMSPNMSEGGVSISFTERQFLVNTANEIYGRYGEPLFGQATPTVKALDW